MIGNNIKRLRIENGMTQKALADKLFVSAQAVSRWENNDVEPSLGTITELSKIFGVSTDEILGVNASQEAEPTKSESKSKEDPVTEDPKNESQKEAPPTPPKQILALCTKCNEPIYIKEDIHLREYSDDIICSACEKAEKERTRELKIAKSKRRRLTSLIVGPLSGIAALLIMLGASPEKFGIAIYFGISIFTFVSCCILANTFVGEMSLSIFSWGFVQMPGIIFSLSVDGIIGFIITKIILALLGLALALLCAILAILIGGLVSIFVYPYAIIKNKRSPEAIEL